MVDAGYAEEQLGNTQSALEAYKTSLRMDTSLFDVRKNPFAANSRLKAMVLTATYDKRLARAAMPRRRSSRMRPHRRAPAAEQGRAADCGLRRPEAPPSATGPIITNVPAASSPARTGNVTPAPPRPNRPPFAPAGETGSPAAPLPPTARPPASRAGRLRAGAGCAAARQRAAVRAGSATDRSRGAADGAERAAPGTTSVVPGPGAGA